MAGATIARSATNNSTSDNEKFIGKACGWKGGELLPVYREPFGIIALGTGMTVRDVGTSSRGFSIPSNRSLGYDVRSARDVIS